MNADNGAESFAIHVDNSQLEREAAHAASLIEGIGEKAVEEARRIDKALDELPKKIEEQEKVVQELTNKYEDQKNAIDNLDKQLLEHKELLELDRKEAEQAQQAYEKSKESKGEWADVTKKLKDELDKAKEGIKGEQDAIRQLNLEKAQEKQTQKEINDERQKEQQTLKDLQGEYKKTQQEAKTMSRSINEAVKKHQQEVAKIPTINDQIASSMKTIGKLSAGYLTVAGAQKFISTCIDVRKELELIEIQFNGLFGEGQGTAMLGDLKGIAMNSGVYKMSGLAQAAETLNIYGEKTEEITELVREFSDVAMGNEQKLNSLATAMGRLNTQGSLNNLTLRTLIRAGFNPLDEIARTTGRSIEQLNADMKNGQISTEMVKNALRSATSEGGKFYKMNEKVGDSIAGEQGRLAAMIKGIYAEWGKEHEDIIKGGYRVAQSLVENYDTIGKTIAVLIATYGAYRTALIATAAVEAATNAGYVTKIRLLRMAATAQAALNSVMMKNPFVLAATALTGLVAATVAFSKSSDVAGTEAERLKNRLDKQAESERNLKDEIQKNTDAINDDTKSEGERQAALDELKKLLPSVFNKYKTWADLQRNLAEATAAANAELERQNIAATGTNFSHDKEMVADLKRYRDALKKYTADDVRAKTIKAELYKKYGKEMFETTWYGGLKFKGQGTFQTDWNFVNQEINKVTESVKDLGEELARKQGKQWDNLLPNKTIKDTQTEIQKYQSLLKKLEKQQSPEAIVAKWKKEGGQSIFGMTTGDKERIQKELSTVMDGTETLTKTEIERRIARLRGHASEVSKREGKDFLTESRKNYEAALKKEKDIINNRNKKDKDGSFIYPSENAYQEALRKAKENTKKMKAIYESNGGDPKADKNSGSTAERNRIKQEEAEEKIQAERLKWDERQAKERAEGQILIAQAEIDAMEDGESKKLAQLKLNHEKELAQIAQQTRELYLAKVEHEKTIWDTNPNNNGKDFYKEHQYDPATGLFSGIGALTQQELDEKGITAKIKSENAAYEHAQADIMKTLLQQYRDYDDERRDIEKKFNDDIAAMEAALVSKQAALQTASTEAERKKLNTQIGETQRSLAKATADKGKALIAHDFEVLKKSPEYTRAFDDLANTSTETLKALIADFEKVKDAAGSSLDPQHLREYMQAISQMQEELMSRNPFETLRNSLDDLRTAQSQTKAAEKSLQMEKQRLQAVQKGLPIITNFKKVNGSIVPILLTEAEAQQNVAKATKRLNEAKDNEAKADNKYRKNLKESLDAVDELAASISGLGDTIGGTEGQILGVAANVMTFTTQTIDGIKAVTATGVAALSTLEKASVILTIISAAIQLFQAISNLNKDAHAQYEEFAEKQKEVNKLKDAVAEYRMELIKAQQEERKWFSSTGLQDLSNQWEQSGEALKQYWEKSLQEQAIYQNESGGGWLTGALSWLGKAVGTLVSIPGKLITGALDKLGILDTKTFLSNVLDWGITGLFGGPNGLIGKGVGELLEGMNYAEGMTAAIKNLRIETRKKSSGFLGTGIGGHSQETEDLTQWVKDTLGLDLFNPDTGMIDTDVAQIILDKYGDELVGETKETLEQLKELKEQYDEFKKQLRDYISELYSPLADNMVDSLWDWLTEGKDVLDSFKKYSSNTFKGIGQEMTKQLINSLIFDKYKEQLANIYEAYAFSKSAGMDEESALQLLEKGILQATDNFLDTTASKIPILQKAVKSLQEGFMARGIDIGAGSDNEKYNQNASYNSLAGMSQDLGEELNGRFTAVQLAAYEILAKIQMQAQDIMDMQQQTEDIRSIMDDLLDLQSEATDYLKKIESHTSVLPTMQQDIAKIKTTISALTTKK